jgi:transcriptional regulator with XRE-family HTH domain
MNTLNEWAGQSAENRRSLAGESLILQVAQKLWEIMEECEISRAQLAESLHRTRSYVTQVLSGSTNVTLRTLSDIGDALDCDVNFAIERRRVDEVVLAVVATPHADWAAMPSEMLGKTRVIDTEKVVQFQRPTAAENQSEWTHVSELARRAAR